jgi:hyperosmotically inducible protein
MTLPKNWFSTRLPIAALALLTLFASANLAQAAVGQTQGGSAVGEYGLSQQVRHQLLMLPWYSVFENLGYQVKGSEVILSGQVLTDTTKHDAERRVKAIAGVTKVINNIEILPASPNDDRIRRAAYRTIFSEPALSMYSVGTVPPLHILVKNGHLTLEGAVLNAGDKQLAGTRAREVHGVLSVTNNLRIENSKTEIPS